jgi:DNA-binding IclR family transcriptional regulator
MTRAATGESVLSRAVRILAAFGPEEPALSVTQLAARTGLHIATVSRLVGQLKAEGLLSMDSEHRVRIGIRLWELASRAAPTRGLRESALPFLEDLHAIVGHHAQLAILDGIEVLFIERLSAPDAVVNYSRVAGRLPLHASSSGLVLLAHATPELRERVLASPLASYTDKTITDPAVLRRVLAEVRRQGFALNPGHVHPEATGVAAPIFDTSGRVIAAVSAIVPNVPEARSTIGVLLATARGITRAISAPQISAAL